MTLHFHTYIKNHVFFDIIKNIYVLEIIKIKELA